MSLRLYRNIDDIITVCISKYGDNIDFSNANYKNTSSILKLRCKIHNLYFQNTAYHLVRGAGCRECRREKIHRAADKKRLSMGDFLIRAESEHNKRYDYSLVEYKSLTDSVTIICHDHGTFNQKPREHFRGHGCQQCASTTISDIGLNWLRSLGIEDLDIEYRINFEDRWYFVDGFNPKTNTVYEFYGDYWHGNPLTTDHGKINLQAGKTFAELYNRTIIRENNIKSLGYNFISIWESEYDKNSI